MRVTYFGAPALTCLTLLEVPEVGTVCSHKRYSSPPKCTPVALVCKMGVKAVSISSLPECVTPFWELLLWGFQRCWR